VAGEQQRPEAAARDLLQEAYETFPGGDVEAVGGLDEDHDAGVLAGDLLHLLPASLTGGLRGAVQELAHPVLRLLQHEQDPGGVLNGLVVDVLLTVEHDDVAGRVGLALRVEHVRQHRDAQRRQVAGGGDAGGAAVDGQRGHVGGALPDQGVAHLLDTRAAGTGEAEYLAAVQLEGDRFGGALQAYDVHHDVGGVRGASCALPRAVVATAQRRQHSLRRGIPAMA